MTVYFQVKRNNRKWEIFISALHRLVETPSPVDRNSTFLNQEFLEQEVTTGFVTTAQPFLKKIPGIEVHVPKKGSF